MNLHQADVMIAGKTYQLTGYENPSYYLQLARVLDRAIRDIQAQNNKMDTEGTVVAAALSLTDELVKAKEELNRLRLQLEQLQTSKPDINLD